ncbi:unnamed protein product [Phytomonas sp. Hart1]|nr:unnamed protein product [Phytomonas sp. Hart1]|eukprot:CCW71036.1 unnamed protein product [Phytomonas sp. isolate Hart1]
MSALIHSPDRFIELPFRRCEKNIPEWELCAKYIATNHSSNNTTTIKNAIKTMTDSHNLIAKVCLPETKSPPTEGFIHNTLKPYCNLIVMAQAHLPLHSAKVSKNLKFLWRDSFKEGLKYESLNANVELVSCIYNLAASYTYVAAHQVQKGTIENIKEAFKNYQNAAGYYTMVKDLLFRVPPEFRNKGDIKQESLELLIKICLAEAHHCGYLKAEEAMKDNQEMLARIAREGAKMFSEVHALMVYSIWYQEKNHLAKKMEVLMSVDTCIFEVRACLHLAVKYEEDSKMGAAIGYYNKALRFLDKLPKISSDSMAMWVDSVTKNVKTAYKKAQDMNASVYYEKVPKEVPDVDGLPRPLGSVIEHTSFINSAFIREGDPFFGIVPFHVSSLAIKWRENERRRVKTYEDAAIESCESVRTKMQQLNVISIIQTLSGDSQDYQHIPEPLRSKILNLRIGPEGQVVSVAQNILDLVNVGKQLQTALNRKLQEILEVFDEEKAKDERLSNSYGEKMWRAVCPALVQTLEYNSIMAAYNMHKQNFDKYVSDQLNRGMQTLDQNLRDIARLDWKISDLDSLMPFVAANKVHEWSTKVKKYVDKLKQVMSDVEATERDQKAAQNALRDLLDSDAVVVGLSAVEPAEQNTVLENESRSISDGISKIMDTTHTQPELVIQAENIIVELSTLQSIDPLAQEIQKVTNDLENACNIYKELFNDFKNIAQYASRIMNEVEDTLLTLKSFIKKRHVQAQEFQEQLDAQIQAKMKELKNIESELSCSRKRQEEICAQMEQLQRSPLSSQQQHESMTSMPPLPFNPYGYPITNNGLPSQQIHAMYFPPPPSGGQSVYENPPPDYNSLSSNPIPSESSMYEPPPSLYTFPSLADIPISTYTPNIVTNAGTNNTRSAQAFPHDHSCT